MMWPAVPGSPAAASSVTIHPRCASPAFGPGLWHNLAVVHAAAEEQTRPEGGSSPSDTGRASGRLWAPTVARKHTSTCARPCAGARSASGALDTAKGGEHVRIVRLEPVAEAPPYKLRGGRPRTALEDKVLAVEEIG